MQEAGVLISCDGLHPPSMGARVSFPGRKPKVVDGPFAEAKEVLGGYWIIDVASRAEAIEWATRCPGGENEVIEVRQIQEAARTIRPTVQAVTAEALPSMQTLKKQAFLGLLSLPGPAGCPPACSGVSKRVPVAIGKTRA